MAGLETVNYAALSQRPELRGPFALFAYFKTRITESARNSITQYGMGDTFSFLRRDKKTTSPRPAMSIAYVSGSGIVPTTITCPWLLMPVASVKTTPFGRLASELRLIMPVPAAPVTNAWQFPSAMSAHPTTCLSHLSPRPGRHDLPGYLNRSIACGCHL
jgi:hypothetical protein